MNKQRRKEIEKAIELIEQALAIIEEARDDEQNYIDKIPENLQQSEWADLAQQAADALDYTCENLGEAIENANTASE